MQKLQNKAMRAILSCDRYTHISRMLSNLKWMTVIQKLELNTLKFIRKMKQGDAPEYLCDQIKYVRESQPYRLKKADDFRIQSAQSTQMQRSLYYKGFQLFNSRPNNIKNEINYIVFFKVFLILIVWSYQLFIKFFLYYNE